MALGPGAASDDGFLVNHLLAHRLAALAAVVALAPAAHAGAVRDLGPRRVSWDAKLRRAHASAGRLALAAPRPGDVPAGVAWTSLGPKPIANLYNPDGTGPYDASGRVRSIAVDPRNGDVAYIAAAQGGVWKTSDGGATWAPLTDHLSSLASGAVTLDPSNPDVVYYGTGEMSECDDCFAGDGLFKSTDAGATWTKLADASQVGWFISRVAVQPGHSATLLVADEYGMARTGDGGKSWGFIAAPGRVTDLAFDPVTAATVYAAVESTGIYKSLDAGLTWSLLQGGVPASGFGVVNFAIAPNAPQILYASFITSSASAATDGHLYGMYRSSNGGTSWSKLTATPDYVAQITGAPAKGWYDNCLVVDPTSSATVYAGGAAPQNPALGLIRSTTSGASWTGVAVDVTGQELHSAHHALAFGPDRRLWDGNDGGVWTTTDGGAHWSNRNAGLALVMCNALALHPSNANVILVGSQSTGSVLTTNAGVSWSMIDGGNGGACAIDPQIYTTSYWCSGPALSFVDRITTGDTSWVWTNDGEPAQLANAPLVLDPNYAGTVYAGTCRVWFTIDDGAFWWPSDQLTSGADGVIGALALGVGAPHPLYAATSEGLVWRIDDNSGGWVLRAAGLPDASWRALAVNPAAWQSVYVAAEWSANGVVWASSNGGQSWTDVSGDFPAGHGAFALAVDWRTVPATLYLGADTGVFVSTTGGAHWTQATSGLPNCAVYGLALDTTNNWLVAATHGRGVWRAAVPLGSAVRGGDGVPDAHAGWSFDATGARLAFTAPAAMHVAVDLFDVRGAHVASLLQETVAAGPHRLTLPAVTPSGVYFAVLRAADGTHLTRRVARLR